VLGAPVFPYAEVAFSLAQISQVQVGQAQFVIGGSEEVRRHSYAGLNTTAFVPGGL
jgi:hypothetical protein